MAATDTS